MPEEKERKERLTLSEFVRENLLPYNTLFALTSFVAVCLGYLSPRLLVFFSISLFVIIGQIVALDLLARADLCEWAKGKRSKSAALITLLWEDSSVPVVKSPVFWTINLIALGVAIYSYKNAF